MKLYIKPIITLMCIAFISCSDVIDVDVPTGQTRLVIEASLDWEKDTSGSDQTINLKKTTQFFDTTTNTDVTGAFVRVTNTDTNELFVFTDQNDGSYTTSNFVPVINNSYSLEIVYHDETYTASETLFPTPDISSITQSLDGGFDDELIDVTLYFNDPANEENYYVVSFQTQNDLFPTFEVFDDEFINGNELDVFFEKEDEENDEGEIVETPLETGDVVYIRLLSVSERYHNFSNLLYEQYDSGGDPFSAVPVEIRGNCINTTNTSNYPYGYFRVTEIDSATYTVE